ncbi:ECF transporter S component [uncultured Subdoligranulum sp.]|uniref:ECF transporter S component n=1 Tax=uncultured Subdoligranulum sp. TaxID=512298 RepID=UPI003208B5AB
MKKRTNVRWLTQLALLVAILLVMNYTPLGYLQIGPLSASLLTLPVAIGAMTMGPLAGTILGAVFGITSFLQAMEGKSALSAAMFGASPVATFVVCVVSRVLMGLCAALLFKGLCKLLPRQEKFCCFAGGLLTAVLNTVFFMGALVLLFYNLPYVQDAAQSMGATNALMFVVLFVGVQAIGEWVTCCLVAGAVALPVRKFLKLN